MPKFTMINGVLPYGGNMLMTQFGPFHTTEQLNRLKTTPTTKALSAHKGDENTYGLLLGILEHNPGMRYDIRQTSRHPWMQLQPKAKGERKGDPWIF